MKRDLHTERLILRQWKDEDRPHFFSLNNDSEVMRYFPRYFTLKESNSYINDNAKAIEETGWGSWAVEIKNTGDFIGFVGLSRPAPWHPCAGSVEIGWRLARQFWGKGYATEAAHRAMEHGFITIGFQEIVSFTAVCNQPSIRVMKKLGMAKDPTGFDHPRIALESDLRPHVVYRLTKQQWLSKQAANAE
ncbi:MAG: GNAT family N-acetyltransferase [Gammaproteobacteria bacterium]|nr:GNAT family N-acetyltransferase [Gammaproteobacteria bacterium]